MQFDEGYSTRCLLSIGGCLSVDIYVPVCELNSPGSEALSAANEPAAPSVRPRVPPPPQPKKKVRQGSHLSSSAEKSVFQSPNLSSKSSHCTRALLKAWLATARSRISRAKSEPDPETNQEIEACLL
jgi:hypothetical protein